MKFPVAPRPDKGLYLGEFLDNGKPHGEIRHRGQKHAISIGAPGANKTTGLVVPNVAHLPRSMVIIDPKGQIASITARKRARMGNVVILNPFGLFVGEPEYQAPSWDDEVGWRFGPPPKPHYMQSHGFNPLAQLNPESENFADDAASIAESLIPIDHNEHQKIFPQGARNLYAALIMHERMTNGTAGSLAGVRRALTARTIYVKREHVKEPVPVGGFMKTLMDMEDSDFPPVANKAGRFMERFGDKSSGNSRIQDVIDTAITLTDKLDSPPIARDLSGGGIDFAKLREEITTVYLILPTAELITHGVWLRLVISSALRALYQTPPPNHPGALPPALFVLDEFAALGRLEAIETALGAARDYGIQLWPFLQDLNQLKDLYPQRWETFLTGAGAVTAFAPRDWFTAEFLSRFCGQKTAIVESNNEGKNAQGGDTSGRSWQPQGLPLIRPEDLMRMPRGQMLCLVEPEPMPFYTVARPYPFTQYGEGLDPNPYFRNRPP